MGGEICDDDIYQEPNEMLSSTKWKSNWNFQFFLFLAESICVGIANPIKWIVDDAYERGPWYGRWMNRSSFGSELWIYHLQQFYNWIKLTTSFCQRQPNALSEARRGRSDDRKEWPRMRKKNCIVAAACVVPPTTHSAYRNDELNEFSICV